MANGSHSSLERMPGALFRAMGVLVLQKKDCAREALAYELKEHLETLGVDYNVRTLKRQLTLTRSVSSVPPEVQGVMRHVLLRANGLRTDLDIDRELRTAGLWVAPEDRQPERLSSERIVPLAQLWLLFNPTHSKRRLAMLLSKRLARQGVHLKVDWYNRSINIAETQAAGTIQPRRPYQPWSDILLLSSGGDSTIHQLQLEAIQRYSRGLTFQMEYSWNRSLDNVPIVGGPQNPYNNRADRGNSDQIRRHIFTVAYSYDLPFGPGKAFAADSRVLNRLIGGWQLAGIIPTCAPARRFP